MPAPPSHAAYKESDTQQSHSINIPKHQNYTHEVRVHAEKVQGATIR